MRSGVWLKCEKKKSDFIFPFFVPGECVGASTWMSEVNEYWQLNGQVSLDVWHFNFVSVDKVRRQLLSASRIRKTNRKQHKYFSDFELASSLSGDPKYLFFFFLFLVLLSEMDGFRWHGSDTDDRLRARMPAPHNWKSNFSCMNVD